MIVGIALGGKLLHEVEPRYTSTALMLLTPRPPGSFGAESQFAAMYVDGARVESVLQILESSNLLNDVVQTQHLADDPEFSAPQTSLIRMLLHKLYLLPHDMDVPASEETRSSWALVHLAHALKVRRVGLTYVIDISVTAGTPQKAQALAQAVAESYLKNQESSKALAAQRDHAWLLSRLRELRHETKSSEEGVEAVRRKYGIAEADNGRQVNTDQQSVEQMNTQLLLTDADVASRRASYEQAQHVLTSGADVGALLQELKSPVIDELGKQHDAIMRRLAEVSQRYTPAYPGVIDALHEKQAIDSVIRAEGVRYVANLRNQYETALAKQQALTKDLARKTTAAVSGSKAQGYIELRDAQRAVDANRSLYQKFMSKLQEVDQQLTRQDPEAHIISPAAAPDSPSFPKPTLLLGGGLFLGMLTGAGLALLRPVPERGFRDPSDLETRLSLPVLGVLPELLRRNREAAKRPSYIPNYLMVRPLSQFSECLRALRVVLRLGAANGPRVVQVTSAVPGEGKTTVAAALAISAAAAGMRTALVDVDIRNPSVSDLFGLHVSEGLADLLQHDTPPSDVLQGYRNLPLTIIPAGRAGTACPDIIAGPRLESLIRNIKQTHDLVILDSSPILSVSDPLITGNIADLNLLVVAFKNTPKPVVAQAIKTLQAVDVALAGVVLNKVRYSRRSRQIYGYGTYGTYQSSRRKVALA
jgi:succinoglycan biosynthesis transport protein ExoP